MTICGILHWKLEHTGNSNTKTVSKIYILKHELKASELKTFYSNKYETMKQYLEFSPKIYVGITTKGNFSCLLFIVSLPALS